MNFWCLERKYENIHERMNQNSPLQEKTIPLAKIYIWKIAMVSDMFHTQSHHLAIKMVSIVSKKRKNIHLCYINKYITYIYC